jgi:hypothetical protein
MVVMMMVMVMVMMMMRWRRRGAVRLWLSSEVWPVGAGGRWRWWSVHGLR